MRSYKQYPSDIQVMTPLGAVFVSVTEATRVYVSFNSSGQCLTVNGGKVRGTANLYRWSDGTWRIGAEGKSAWDQRLSLYARKVRDSASSFDDPASEKQREKIAAAVIAAVADLLKKRPALLRDAQLASINNRLMSLEEEQVKLQTKLAEINGECAALAVEEEALSKQAA